MSSRSSRSVAMAVALALATLAIMSMSAEAHNITRILGGHPQFSSFNRYLTLTHLASEINRRLTITVLAVDNAALAGLAAHGYSIYTIRNILSLHVLADYYGAKKLHQLTHSTTLVSSLFQSSGSATGTAGYINITSLHGGKVGFGVQDSGKLTAHFVKSIKEAPYNISILQISSVLVSEEAEAPASGPPQFNLSTVLSEKHGCEAFGNLLRISGVDLAFQTYLDAGLTVFCPTDAAVKSFMPRYNNLTEAHQHALLRFHGMATYNSLQMFKQNNGEYTTLASAKHVKYDLHIKTVGEDISLLTNAASAKVDDTILNQEPLSVYEINSVLLPDELFKPANTKSHLAPAPKRGGSGTYDDDDSSSDSADGPGADSPGSNVDDQTADDSNASPSLRASTSVGALFLMAILLLRNM